MPALLGVRSLSGPIFFILPASQEVRKHLQPPELLDQPGGAEWVQNREGSPGPQSGGLC